MSDSTIRVKRLAYVRVSAPDLEVAEKFLDEFGLQVAARTDAAIYLRGTDPDPPCYVLTRGEPGVKAIAFEADSEADLEKISKVEGASKIEKLEDPAGGRVVRLVDPQGTALEIVHGQTPLPPIDPAPSHAFNVDGKRRREGELPAFRPGPSHVKRIGHLVLESGDPLRVYGWYHEHLGLQKSDEVQLPTGATQIRFARVDRGKEFVDHHVVGFQFSIDEGARVQHIAFEVGNVDDLMAGHDHLKSKRRKNVWGVGRHRFGGQIFDYWASPLGVIHEHWTDTDLVNEDHVPTEGNLLELEDYWGPPPTLGFAVARWNWKVFRNVAKIAGAHLRSQH